MNLSKSPTATPSSLWRFIKSRVFEKKNKNDINSDYDDESDDDESDDDKSDDVDNSNIHNDGKRKNQEIDNIDALLKLIDDNDKTEDFAHKLHDDIMFILQNEKFDGNGLVICFDNLAEFILTLLNSIENKVNCNNNDDDDDKRSKYQTIILILSNELLIRATNSYFDNNNNSVSVKNLHEILKWFGWWYNTISKVQLQVDGRCFEILIQILNKQVNANSISNNVNDYIECICDRYLFGSLEDSEQNLGASYNLGELCFTLLKNFTRNPNEYLMQHSDGTLYTTVTIGLWELFHINLDLARDSKVSILSFKTIRSIIAIQTFILEKILHFLSHEKSKILISTNIITSSKAILHNSEGVIFDLMIALTNDCAIQMNELVTIVSDNQSNECSELLSQVGVTLTAIGNSLLKDISEVIIYNFIGNNLCYKLNDITVVINSLHSHLSFLFHKLLPFWNEKLIVCMYEKVMNVFVSSIIYAKYFNRVEIMNTLATIQKEFVTYDNTCVKNSIYTTEAMNWLLNLLQTIYSEDRIYFEKLIKQCHMDDIDVEVLTDFCKIRNLSMPLINRGSDDQKLQYSRIIRNVISSQQFVSYHQKQTEIIIPLEFNKIELFTLLGKLKNENNTRKNNIKKFQTLPKRRWSRIKSAS